MGMSREFKGIWIPKNIWFSKDLSLQEKIFMVEIDSLNAKENGERHCYATNKYFSAFFGLSKNRCSSIISGLEKKGYISVTYKRDGKEIKERYIDVSQKWNTLFQNQDLSIPNMDRGIPKTNNRYSENSEEYNTINYNTKDSIKNTYTQDCENVLNQFKTICVSLPKPRGLTEPRKKAIKSRLKEYSMEDIIEVFNLTEKSDFLTGRNSSWKANFDWLLLPKNFIKVLEGNYANKQNKPKGNFYRADANTPKEKINQFRVLEFSAED